MKMPPELKPALQGAAAGAIALAIIGFTWGGWVTKGTADAQAGQRARAEVVAALTPICVENFRRSSDPANALKELKNTNSWSQGSFVEKAGWATMPGSALPDSTLARACAEKLGDIKL
jgi:hypothetical protein